MMIVIASIAVGLVAFIIYALERRTKNEPIMWDSAGKLSLMSSLITAGVVFATTADISSVKDAVESASSVMPDVQDMFVGSPTF